jgi:uncharacterized iron-regulated protein
MLLRPPLAALAILCATAACTHAAPASQVLLLGEVHDNPAGHAARMVRLREEIEAGWRPAIAMEQFDGGQQAALDAAMRDCTDADCVIENVVTAKSAWNWAHYAPVIALALEYRLPLLAANLSRTDASNVVKDGFSASLPADVIARYGLDAPPADVLRPQEAEVRDNHCGALPEPMVAPMAKAQIARDIVMAMTVQRYADRGVVLIAGNGHVRKDIGVPYWLRREQQASEAVGFLEPTADAAAFDTVQRIPAWSRPDPCATFKPPKAG